MGLPIPNLDDKTFDEIIKEARSLIARYSPGWTDHNVHDPGITFIELFAWLAEMQIYRLNRITDTNYRKFLKLVGFSPFSARPAKVDITFEKITIDKGIDAGTQVMTQVGTEKIVFEADEEYAVIPVVLKSVRTNFGTVTIDNTEANEKDDVYFAAFGGQAPLGATLSLGFDTQLPEKEISLTIDLFEDDLPSPGTHGEEPAEVFPSAEVVWEYLSGGTWKALALKSDTTSALTQSGRVNFTGPVSMDKKDGLYWVRGRLAKGGYEIIPEINRILLNTISATQIETIRNEELGEGTGMPDQRFSLDKAPVTGACLAVEVHNEDKKWVEWLQVDCFESSGPDDIHYTFHPDKSEITFGNGLNGSVPGESQKIRALYKTTLGAGGNIPKGQNFEISGGGSGKLTGKNLRRASSGKNAESLEDAIDRARKDFRTPYRALTSGDYEQLALSTPGVRVARAKAIPFYHPDYPCIPIPGIVSVVVVPYTRGDGIMPIPGNPFLHTVLNHLERHRIVTTSIFVSGPEFVKISVKARAFLKKNVSPIEAKKHIDAALKEFLDPLKGGEHGDGWPFGRSVFLSEIYQIIDTVEGVDYVTGVSLNAEGKYEKAGDAIKIPPVALVFSGDHAIEIP